MLACSLAWNKFTCPTLPSKKTAISKLSFSLLAIRLLIEKTITSKVGLCYLPFTCPLLTLYFVLYLPFTLCFTYALLVLYLSFTPLLVLYLVFTYPSLFTLYLPFTLPFTYSLLCILLYPLLCLLLCPLLTLKTLSLYFRNIAKEV